MKYLSSVLLVVVLVSVGVFGFAALDMGMDHGSGCVAAAVNGVACPTNIADFATHHASALQALTRTEAPTAPFLLLMLALLFLAFLTSAFFIRLHPQPELALQRLRRLPRGSFSRNRQKALSWLSLLELSPAL